MSETAQIPQIVAHPRSSLAMAGVQCIGAILAAAFAVWGLSDFLQAPYDPLTSGAFWFGLFGADFAILAFCSACWRLMASSGKLEPFSYPYWLYAPLAFLALAGILASSRADLSSDRFFALSLNLIAAGVACTTAGAVTAQWQLQNTAARAAVAEGPVSIVPPRYPLAVACLSLLAAEPGLVLVAANDQNLKGWILVVLLPIIAIGLLWESRKSKTGVTLDATGIEGLAAEKIHWRDLASVRIIAAAGFWPEPRCVQLLFESDQACPPRTAQPQLPEQVSPPNSFSVMTAPLWLPSRLVAMVLNERMRRFRHDNAA